VRKLCQVFAYRGYDQPRFREICDFYETVFLLPLAEVPIQAGQGQRKVVLETPLIIFLQSKQIFRDYALDDDVLFGA